MHDLNAQVTVIYCYTPREIVLTDPVVLVVAIVTVGMCSYNCISLAMSM